jgi:phosphatidate phosphatase APP1
MTTPPAPPSLSLTTDAASYLVGQTLTLTAVYADSQASPVDLTITATATDSQGNTVSAEVDVTVLAQASESMDVEASDNAGDTYTVVSNVLNPDGTGTAVLTTTVSLPAGG